MSKILISTCLAAVLLVGCGSVTPAGLTAVSRLDPLESPLSDLVVAISIPEALRLRNGDAEFRLGFTPEDQSATDVIDETVPLTHMDGIEGPRPTAVGETIYVLGFSTQDAANLTHIQDQIKTMQAQDIKGTGTLSITIRGGCLTNDLAQGLVVSTWLRIDPAANFVLLTRNVNLLDVLPPARRAQLKGNLIPC